MQRLGGMSRHARSGQTASVSSGQSGPWEGRAVAGEEADMLGPRIPTCRELRFSHIDG